MTGAEYIAMYLSVLGTTDVFGIPGGVVLDLIYAFDRQDGITPHLSYHEQSAGFAACGFAQASGTLGVAYATRGPGFTNLLTAVADAFFDSVPVLFLTAHSADCPPDGMRVMSDQEMDTCGMVRKITKYSARIDALDDLPNHLHAACQAALHGRKGAVFLDVSAKVLCGDVGSPDINSYESGDEYGNADKLAHELIAAVRKANRPVLLVGDGINQAGAGDACRSFLVRAGIPCISSRFSHNLASRYENYFGYVGSHGIRAANFILSKADLIVSLGNRLNVPIKSSSFSKVLSQAKFLRYDIDESEFGRELPNVACRKCDVTQLFKALRGIDVDLGRHEVWINVCRELARELDDTDVNEAVACIEKIMVLIPSDALVVSDVGNLEFFVSRAAVKYRLLNRLLYSKSFGAMGSAIGRSIGAYYATRKPVVCFVGDQGFQFNVQELQFVSLHRLPIVTVLLNNGVSGMIRDKEHSKGYGKYLHVSADTGFSAPSMSKLSECYGMDYLEVSAVSGEMLMSAFKQPARPLLVDCKIAEDVALIPTLPANRLCQDLCPELPAEKYKLLDKL